MSNATAPVADEQAAAAPAQSKSAIAKQDEAKKIEIEKRVHILAALLSGDRKKAERYLQLATIAVSKSPGLLEVSKEKLWLAIQQIATLGLDIGPMGAYLLPFKGDAQVIISPQGFIELAHRSGFVRSVMARVVYSGEDFDIEYAPAPQVRHKPSLTGVKGEPIGAYAIVHLMTGDSVVEYMTKDEIEAVRGRSPAWNGSRGPSGPWVTDPGEMWRKTALKRVMKYTPKSAEMRDAIELDNAEYTAIQSGPVQTLPVGRGTAGTLARLGVGAAQHIEVPVPQAVPVGFIDEEEPLPI